MYRKTKKQINPSQKPWTLAISSSFPPLGAMLLARSQWVFFVWCLVGSCLVGCNPAPITSRVEIWEGPSLHRGRMSANLGMTLLPDGRVVLVGGSPVESPFQPLTGKESIEIAEKSCILSAQCKLEKANCQCWKTADIDLKYGMGGILHPLPDGRLLSFASVYVFNRESATLDPTPPDKDSPSSGSVSAVIIDLTTKQVIPIYRPENNEAGKRSINPEDNLALLQRVFERSIQLRDGRIVRIGGHVIYQKATPTRTCENNICQYCEGNKCTPSQPGIACKTETVTTDCPLKKGATAFTVLDAIELYTPPDSKNPKGSVRTFKMDAARSSVGAIEMADGRVLIVGGWGPKGDGSNQDYRSTYILDPNKEGTEALQPGPKTLFYREDHAMATLKDGRVLITGGTDLNEITIKTSEYYDPVKKIFTHADSMIVAREDHVPMFIGPWLMFIGGEDNGKTDLVHNSVEFFNAQNGKHIGPQFLFATSGTNESLTGVDDFGAVSLDAQTVLITGGQQGRQDPDGDFISSGRGSTRTLIFQYRESR